MYQYDKNRTRNPAPNLISPNDYTAFTIGRKSPEQLAKKFNSNGLKIIPIPWSSRRLPILDKNNQRRIVQPKSQKQLPNLPNNAKSKQMALILPNLTISKQPGSIKNLKSSSSNLTKIDFSHNQLIKSSYMDKETIRQKIMKNLKSMRKAKSNLRPKQLASLEVGKGRAGQRQMYGDMS